jgi:hypothetical protein
MGINLVDIVRRLEIALTNARWLNQYEEHSILLHNYLDAFIELIEAVIEIQQ